MKKFTLMDLRWDSYNIEERRAVSAYCLRVKSYFGSDYGFKEYNLTLYHSRFKNKIKMRKQFRVYDIDEVLKHMDEVGSQIINPAKDKFRKDLMSLKEKDETDNSRETIVR